MMCLEVKMNVNILILLLLRVIFVCCFYSFSNEDTEKSRIFTVSGERNGKKYFLYNNFENNLRYEEGDVIKLICEDSSSFMMLLTWNQYKDQKVTIIGNSTVKYALKISLEKFDNDSTFFCVANNFRSGHQYNGINITLIMDQDQVRPRSRSNYTSYDEQKDVVYYSEETQIKYYCRDIKGDYMIYSIPPGRGNIIKEYKIFPKRLTISDNGTRVFCIRYDNNFTDLTMDTVERIIYNKKIYIYRKENVDSLIKNDPGIFSGTSLSLFILGAVTGTIFILILLITFGIIIKRYRNKPGTRPCPKFTQENIYSCPEENIYAEIITQPQIEY